MASKDSHVSGDQNDRRSFLQLVGGTSVAASTTLLAGCGGDSETPTATEPDDDGDTTPGGDDDTETPASGDRHGGSLTLAIPTEITGIPGSLHAQFFQGGGASVLEQIGYLWAGKLLDWDDGALVPQLATDWEVSNEGRTITFTLREGVTFHDGSEFTAEDVNYTFRHAFRSDVPSGVYEPFNYVENPEEAVEVVGDHEVAFHFPEYDAGALGKLARPNAYIIPDGAYEEFGGDPTEYGSIPDAPPIGTGPFSFEESVTDNTLTFTRFEDFYGEGDGGQLPYLDEVTVQLTQSAEPRVTSLITGDVDVASGVPPQSVSQLDNTDGVESIVQEGARLLRLDFNHTHWEPVNPNDECLDVNDGTADEVVAFKQAVMHALNTNPINGAMWEGMASVNHAHMPSWHNIYQLAEEEGNLNSYDHDPERAQELLDEAGVTPEDVNWNFITEQETQRNHTAMAIMEQQLGNVGFDINPNPLLRPEGYSNWSWNGPEDCPTSPPEDQQTMMYGLDVTNPDPVSWLGPQRWGAGARQNRAHYTGGSELSNQAQQTQDPEEREPMFVELLTNLNNNVAEGSIMWYPRLWGRSSSVQDLVVGPYQRYRFTNVWLDE